MTKVIIVFNFTIQIKFMGRVAMPDQRELGRQTQQTWVRRTCQTREHWVWWLYLINFCIKKFKSSLRYSKQKC
jgi:hypothetical protein